MIINNIKFDSSYNLVHIDYSSGLSASIAFFLDKKETMHWFKNTGICTEDTICKVLSSKFKFKCLSCHDSSTSFKNAQTDQ
jgi:hypothetical protein